MGFWTAQVVPRIANRSLATPDVQEIRARVCEGLHGDVVEIGFGSGLNVPYYPRAVTRVYAVEPSDVAARLARDRVAASRVPVERAGRDGQRLDLADDRFDAALSTLTLCTIPDVHAALLELRRVLKPGGAFHFLEHGRSPDDGVARWQDRLEPVNRRIAGGCHLTREIDTLIIAAGFEIEALRTHYEKRAPKPFGYLFEGLARKPRLVDAVT